MSPALRDIRVRFALDRWRAFCTLWVMQFQSHRDIIDAVWNRNLEAYAGDIGAKFEAARAHYTRNSIAPDYWATACNVAQAKGFRNVTEALLTELKPRRKKPRAKSTAEIEVAA